MDLLQVEYDCISVVLGVHLLRFICKAALCHIESKIHLICDEFSCVRQELAEEVETVYIPTELERIKEFVLTMTEIFISLKLSYSVLGEKF